MSRVTRAIGASIGVLLLTACSGDPATDTEPVADTGQTEQSEPATASETAGSASTPDTPTADDATTAGDATDDATTEDAEAQSTSLDESVRHPNGTVLTLDTITYTDTTIEIEMEVRNGHTQEIELPIGGHQGNRLRLVDDQDHTYNFVVPTGEGNSIEVAPGEAVSGTFVFLGPLDDAAGSVSLVWGVREPGDYSLDGERAGTNYPGFVVRDLPVG